MTTAPSFEIEHLAEFDDHELVLRFSDRETKLRGFTAIHNTNRGPAVGGTRYSYYASEGEALRDALRLSRAMTYKCALADVPYGGGKTVLIAPRSPDAANKLKTEKYLAAYARIVDLLGGTFFTGEDVGLTERDINILARHSTHIIGRPSVGSLPAYWAALSVYESMRAALVVAYGTDSFKDKVVAIKGLGNVGFDLANMLSKAGARIIGSETNKERVQRARKHIPGITLVRPADVGKHPADIFSPCALGGDLSRATIPQLKAKIVCGAANNQCESPEDGVRLFKRGILYVPDYIANGGGLINVVDELTQGGYNRSRVEQRVTQVYTTVLDLLKTAGKRHQSPSMMADIIGKRRFYKRKV